MVVSGRLLSPPHTTQYSTNKDQLSIRSNFLQVVVRGGGLIGTKREGTRRGIINRQKEENQRLQRKERTAKERKKIISIIFTNSYNYILIKSPPPPDVPKLSEQFVNIFSLPAVPFSLNTL